MDGRSLHLFTNSFQRLGSLILCCSGNVQQGFTSSRLPLKLSPGGRFCVPFMTGTLLHRRPHITVHVVKSEISGSQAEKQPKADPSFEAIPTVQNRYSTEMLQLSFARENATTGPSVRSDFRCVLVATQSMGLQGARGTPVSKLF